MPQLIKMSSGPVDGVQLNDSGAIIHESADQQSVLDAMKKVAKAGRVCNFILGDLLNFAKEKWGEDIQAWSRVTGLEKATLWKISQVAKKVHPDTRRVGVLSYDHHRAVALLDPADQKHWLELAEKKGMPSRMLRKSIEIGRVATKAEMAPEPETNRGYDNIIPHVNRLTSFLQKKGEGGNFDSMTPDQILIILEDIQPVLQQAWDIVMLIEESGDPGVIREAEGVLSRAGWHVTLSDPESNGDGVRPMPAHQVEAEIIE